MPKKSTNPFKVPSARAEDQPATRKMLNLVRNELIQKMDAGFKSMDARFGDHDAQFKSIDAQFRSIDARFEHIDSQFKNVDARFVSMDARLARMELLLEEQNANNRIVLEGLQALWQRQERVEQIVR